MPLPSTEYLYKILKNQYLTKVVPNFKEALKFTAL